MNRLDPVRASSYGQEWSLTPVDRLGVWLSGRSIRAATGSVKGSTLGDFGAGFEARITRSLLPQLKHAVVVDLSISDDLQREPKVTVVEGQLPAVMSKVADSSLDVALCISVLEHLWEPELMLAELYRVLRTGGTCIVSVPTWQGKRFLELSAFRLGLSPAEEMDDHKTYYDPKDLWPLLVRAGFVPHAIRCRRHKLGLNTLAVCQKEQP
jgi:SAM-dependent methyltransferase